MAHVLLLCSAVACCASPPPVVTQPVPPEPEPTSDARPPLEVEPAPLAEPPALPGPRLVLQTEHTDSINAVRFARDDQLIFTAGADGALKLRDLEGRVVWTQPTGGELITADISGDGLTAAVVMRTGRALLLPLGADPIPLAGPNPYVTRVALSADGERAVTSDTAGGVSVWGRTGERLARLPGPTAAVWAVAISRDGQVIAAGDELGTVWVGNADGSRTRLDNAHGAGITALALGPYGERWASAAKGKPDPQSPGGSAGTAIKLWHAGQLLTEIPSPHTGSIRFSADGSTLVSAARYDGTVRTWRAGTVREFAAGRDSRQRAALVDVSADGESVVSASDDLRLVRLWRAGQAVELTRYEPPWTTSLAFGGNGELVVGGWDGYARIWSARGALVSVTAKHQATVDAVAVSPDGSLIATGSQYTRLWNRAGEPVRVLGRNTHHAGAVAFSADGKRVFSGDGKGTIHIHTIIGKRVRSFRGHKDRVYSLAASADGAHLVSGAPFGELKLWRKEFREPKTLSGHGAYGFVYDVEWAPGDEVFASVGGGVVHVWNRQGALVHTIDISSHNNANVGAVAMSSDGRIAVSVNDEIHEWRAGERLRVLRAHENTVYALAYSPDGRLLASGGREQALRLWCGAQSAALIPRDRDWLALTPDGFYAASPGGRDLVAWVDGFAVVNDPAAREVRERSEAIERLLACD